MKYTPKKIITAIYHRLVWFFRINILKTLYINFKTQPLHKAIKLPIFIYGKLKIHSLKGQMIIDAPINTGMVKIGFRYFDLFPTAYLPNQLWITGRCIFKGKAIISGGVGLFVQKNYAVLEIGKCCTIGAGSLVKSMNNISIGENTRIIANCMVMDSNMHYVKNIETGVIQKHWGQIIIGKNCWLNTGTIVAKDTVIPDYSITTRNSFLNKDYSEFGTNLFLAGSPAELRGPKVQLILSTKEEMRLNNIFLENTTQSEIKEDIGMFNDKNDYFN